MEFFSPLAPNAATASMGFAKYPLPTYATAYQNGKDFFCIGMPASMVKAPFDVFQASNLGLKEAPGIAAYRGGEGIADLQRLAQLSYTPYRALPLA